MSAAASPIALGPMPLDRFQSDADVDRLKPRTVAVAQHFAGGLDQKELVARFCVKRTVIVRELDRFADVTGARTRREVVLAIRHLGLEPV